MQQTQAARATRKINEEYEKLVKDEFYKGNAARDAVTPYLTEASTEIDNVKNDLADIGLPPILVMKIGMPKHDFSPIQRRLKAEQFQHRGKCRQQRTTPVPRLRKRGRRVPLTAFSAGQKPYQKHGNRPAFFPF